MVKAIAVLKGDSNVSGIVRFEQESEDQSTKISWEITGNDANALRGFHIHEFGDNSNGLFIRVLYTEKTDWCGWVPESA